MKKKVLSALLCAAMAVSMLAGCGGSKLDSKEADKSATESTKAASDTFTFAIGGDTGNTLNPITADDRWGLMTCHMVYSPAYYIYQDGTMDWILAESMDASEDGKVYTMKLKEGLKWSDGEPLTADDIVFTFNSINDMKQNLYVGGEPIKVEKVDDTTVTFTLAEPSASVVDLLSAETFILPKHIFEGKGSFDVNMLEDKVVRMLGTVWKCVDVGFGHNRPVDAVIRPEDIDLVKPGEGVIDGIVTNLIFKGVHYEMEVLANNYELLVHSTDMFPVGTEVGIKVDPFDIQIMKKPESEDEEAPAVEE